MSLDSSESKVKFCLCLISNENSPGRSHLDAADSIAWLDGDSDVAFLTPVGAPRVFDEPVVQTLLATIANDGHRVINRIIAHHRTSTRGSVKNSAPVILEDLGFCLDSSSDWLMRQGLLHHIDIAGFTKSERLDLGACCLLLVVLAFNLVVDHNIIWVVRGSHHLLSLQFLNSWAKGTTIATR